MIDLNGKSIFITGGTGSLGKALVRKLVENFPNLGEIIVYSRDEQKHFQMANELSSPIYDCVKFIVGDVRDRDRLVESSVGVDFLIHAAAMKHVHVAELNPSECIKTNIGGAQNVLFACFENNIQRVVALSTDKACAPINLYGATKLTSDKLFIAANNLSRDSEFRFSVVRYGNVMGSNGSVIPYFIRLREIQDFLPITDKRMTRFNISLDDGVSMIFEALEKAWGGEIFVPKIPSYKILDIAKAIAPNHITKEIGIRPGEKLHEEMISSSDSYNTYDIGKYYTIVPSLPAWNIDDYISHFDAKKVPAGFHYDSSSNNKWETVTTLRKLIKEHVDTTFKII